MWVTFSMIIIEEDSWQITIMKRNGLNVTRTSITSQLSSLIMFEYPKAKRNIHGCMWPVLAGTDGCNLNLVKVNSNF